MDNNQYTDNFGEETFDRGNRVYLDLRAGYIAETTKTLALDEHGEPYKHEIEKYRTEGYGLQHTENKAGKKSFFMAKIKKSISGYVTDLKWYANTLRDSGVTLTGWKVVIETPALTYWLQISTKDRGYSQFMNSLLCVDFDHTVKFKGYEKDGKKNLLLYQGDADGSDFIRGKHKMCMVNALLRNKIREDVPLTEKERESVVFGADGSIDKNYPYIFERSDRTWNFDNWNDFLLGEIKKHSAPAIAEANEKRGTAWKQSPQPLSHEEFHDVPADTQTWQASAGVGGTTAVPVADPDAAAERSAIVNASNDDIPF